jgi:hypothetical protein
MDPIPPSPGQYVPAGQFRRSGPDSVEPQWWPAWLAFGGLPLSFCVIGGPVGAVAAVFGMTLLRRQPGPAAKIAVVVGALDVIVSGIALWYFIDNTLLCHTACG